jgi:hypothetical protein
MTAPDDAMPEDIPDDVAFMWDDKPFPRPVSYDPARDVDHSAPSPDPCVSSITVGKVRYWCRAGSTGHSGLCAGSDQWGGRAEWRWWRAK